MNRYYGDPQTTETERHVYELICAGTRFYGTVLIAYELQALRDGAEQVKHVVVDLRQSDQPHLNELADVLEAALAVSGEFVNGNFIKAHNAAKLSGEWAAQIQQARRDLINANARA